MNYLALTLLVVFAVGAQADLRDTLVQNAHELEKSVEMALTLLKETNMTREAEALAKEETQLKELTGELLAVPSGHQHHHELIVLERKLSKLEATISHQLQALSRSPEIIRQEILDNFQNASALVEEEAKHLEEQNFAGFADEIRKDLAAVAALVDELRETHDHQDIIKLDKAIFDAGKHIANKLDVLRRDLHDFQILLNVTESLINDVHEINEELVKRNLTDAVELLRVDLAELELVRDQLKQEKSIFVFDYLEDKVWDLEKELYRKLIEIKRSIHQDDEVDSVEEFSREHLGLTH